MQNTVAQCRAAHTRILSYTTYNTLIWVFYLSATFFSLFSFAAHHKLMAGHSLFRPRRTRKGNLYRKKHPHQLWTMWTDDRKYCRKDEILEKWLGSGGTRIDTHKHTQMTFIQENGEDQPFPKPWCIIFFVPKWNQTTSDLSMMILNNGKTSNQGKQAKQRRKMKQRVDRQMFRHYSIVWCEVSKGFSGFHRLHRYWPIFGAFLWDT